LSLLLNLALKNTSQSAIVRPTKSTVTNVLPLNLVLLALEFAKRSALPFTTPSVTARLIKSLATNVKLNKLELKSVNARKLKLSLSALKKEEMFATVKLSNATPVNVMLREEVLHACLNVLKNLTSLSFLINSDLLNRIDVVPITRLSGRDALV
jgi:hypothetical protein